MAIYTNNSDETFVFPSVGVIVGPGESFETDETVTTEGVEISTDKKAKIVKPEIPVETVVDDTTPADPAPADPADAPVTQ
jgi:hypothetical protein